VPGTYTVLHTDQFGADAAVVVKHPLRVADQRSIPPFSMKDSGVSRARTEVAVGLVRALGL